MDVESSREIDSLSSHDISNKHAPKFHLFCERDDTKRYRIGTRSESPTLIENNIAFEMDWLDEGLDFDLALYALALYIAANYINDNEIEMPPFVSWIVFNSMVTDNRTIQSDLDYFPVIPYPPPNESVFKDYLDFLIDLESNLETNNIFYHSDQNLFYKISQILWKEGEKYREIIINIMDGFYILSVNLKILYNKYCLLGLRG